MDIKQSFLNSLVGLELDEAQDLIKKAGLQVWLLPEGTITILLAYGDTVKLWYNEETNKVVEATAGDPLQVEHDV